MVVKVSEQINRQNNTAYNNKFWGDAMYNAPIYGVVPGGTDVTEKLQALIDQAIEEGRRAIYFPAGEYYVTSLTDDDQVDFFGDNASFTGGYTGTIRQMGDWASTAQLADIALNAKNYASLNEALAAAVEQGKRLYLPNGTYNVETLLTVTSDINSPDADKLVVIEGESMDGVFITSSSLSQIMDFTKSKFVSIKNLTSDKFIGIMNYASNEYLNQFRTVYIENVLNTNPSGEPINWKMLISTPAPSSYAENSGGAYSRYPVEIYNYGGYNGIMINNFNLDEDGNILPTGSAENSAIGITDAVNNATGVILIDIKGSRSFLQFKNANALYKSTTRANVVYEVLPNGHIAIGCSGQSDDTLAPGVGIMKLRGDKPTIRLYDASNSNKQLRIEYESGFFNLVVDGTTVLKFNGSGELINFAPNGISTDVRIRDASHTRGFQFYKVSGNVYRILYTDTSNDLRTAAAADAASDKAGALLHVNRSGTTANRPTLANTTGDIGTPYFDTTLGYQVCWNGTNWVNGAGTTV